MHLLCCQIVISKSLITFILLGYVVYFHKRATCMRFIKTSARNFKKMLPSPSFSVFSEKSKATKSNFQCIKIMTSTEKISTSDINDSLKSKSLFFSSNHFCSWKFQVIFREYFYISSTSFFHHHAWLFCFNPSSPYRDTKHVSP